MCRLAFLAVLTASLVGCSSRGSEESTANPQQTTSAQDTALGHVHGLGVDPGGGTLYVASHYGVFRVEDGVPGRVADRWQDTMGFAVVGPGHFLGSGHPDLRDDLPPHLGLIESVDGGESWTSVSRLGEADFHAIEPVGNRIYAYDSISGSLQVTTDRESWDTIATLAVIDLAADPDAPETVYATTERGVLVRSTDRGEPTRVAGAPTLTAIDWEADGPLVGIAPTAPSCSARTARPTGGGPEPWTAPSKPSRPPPAAGMPPPSTASTSPPTTESPGTAWSPTAGDALL